MASDNWKQANLGEQVDLLTGFPFKSAEYTEDVTGIPLVRGDNVVQGMFRWDDVKRWSREKVEILSDYFLNKNDVVLAMDRPWIEAGLKYACVSEHDIPCLLVQRVSRLRAKTTLDQKFLRYVIGSPEFTNYILGTQTGTAVPHISSNQIKGYQFLLPPIPEQRAIAGILGALDDKIEVNRRMNVTLESMARAVFRQWFVESEEVGNWEVGRLGDVIKNFDSKRVPVANRERAQKQGKYPYYGAATIMDYVDDYLFDGIYVLMGEDGSVVDKENHPVLQYVWGKFWANNHAHVLQGTNGICNEHLYLFLKDVNILPYITGAVQPKINQANMNSIPFVLPPKELSKKFEEFVSPLFTQIRANDEESRTLGSLRDGLLPKLMRGEVRVRAA
jgi:type I restriction enzyme S subunit